MKTYRIVFKGHSEETVGILARDDHDACAKAERIHATLRDPVGYEVWHGARHVFCRAAGVNHA
jgi:hypothetical protein